MFFDENSVLVLLFSVEVSHSSVENRVEIYKKLFLNQVHIILNF